MSFSTLALAIAVILLAFGFGYLEVNPINLAVNDTALLQEKVALVSSTRPVTATRYDSFESPRGTDYKVPAGTTLYITQLVGFPQSATGTSEYVEVGYGDTAVGNSTDTPDATIVVFTTTWESIGGTPVVLSVFIPIPTGKFPYARMNAVGSIQAVGIERR